MPRCSWIDLLQKGAQVREPDAPKSIVVAQPVEERSEALRLRSVEDIPALGSLRDESSPLQRFEVLRDGSLCHAARARQLGHIDLTRAGDALEHGPPSRIGEGTHDVIDAGTLDHRPIN